RRQLATPQRHISLLLPHLFILMTRPPPISTLFPYTTLFRSLDREAVRVVVGGGGDVVHPVGVRDPHRVGLGLEELLGPAVEVTEDRKSTRLNSSHSQISYAVFCLKKKNNTVRHRHANRKMPP